jgi:hypothetical protein
MLLVVSEKLVTYASCNFIIGMEAVNFLSYSSPTFLAFSALEINSQLRNE